MTDRVCGRGCVTRGRHMATCLGDPCRGCEPVEAADDALLCERCCQRLIQTLKQAPELIAHLRSLVDPLKAQAFKDDKLAMGKASFPPAPVNVDLFDAERDIITVLAFWAGAFGDRSQYRVDNGFPSSTSPEGAYGVAKWASDYLVFNMQRILNDDRVVGFSRAILDPPKDSHEWTLSKALRRFPLHDVKTRWATRPCPYCGLRAVLVTLPTFVGEPVQFECRGCLWVPSSLGLDEWSTYFGFEVGDAP